jgi:hypothetical protein
MSKNNTEQRLLGDLLEENEADEVKSRYPTTRRNVLLDPSELAIVNAQRHSAPL